MTLKTAFEPFFKMGVAISKWDVDTPSHLELVKEQFNSMTCENDMKPMYCLALIFEIVWSYKLLLL